MPKKYFFTIAFISWIVFVTLFSLISFKEVAELPSIRIPHLDKLVHLCFYLGFTLLGFLAWEERVKGRVYRSRTVLLMVGLAVIYGIVIEVLQAVLTQDREGDFWDVLANSLGAFLGGLLIRLIFSRKSPST